MFLPKISRPSCASAWLAASQAVYALPGHHGHHVVIDVDNPVASSGQEAALVEAVDAFLAEHGGSDPVRRPRCGDEAKCGCWAYLSKYLRTANL